jgi:hypothetical protein
MSRHVVLRDPRYSLTDVRGKKRALDYPVFDHKSDERFVIGSIPGSTPQLNVGVGAAPTGVLFQGHRVSMILRWGGMPPQIPGRRRPCT